MHLFFILKNKVNKIDLLRGQLRSFLQGDGLRDANKVRFCRFLSYFKGTVSRNQRVEKNKVTFSSSLLSNPPQSSSRLSIHVPFSMLLNLTVVL